MKQLLRCIGSLLLAAALLVGTFPAAQAAGGVAVNGIHGDVLNEDPYDAIIGIANVRNDKVFSWPSEGNVLVHGGATVTSTLKRQMTRLDGMVIPANLVVDFYYTCAVTNSATFPHGYTFLAQYDTRDGKPVTVDAQQLLFELDRTFGLHLADDSTTTGVPFHGLHDVRPVDYYADAVAWALEAGITTGTSDATFSPDGTVTRAQAVTFLWRAAGCPVPAADDCPFTDVPAGAYFREAVLWAVEEGVTTGVASGRFGPAQDLSYAQLLTFLARAAGAGASGADWAGEAVDWAAAGGLTEGISFTAQAPCPRRDVVTFLWRQMAGEGNAAGDLESWENPTLSDREAACAAIVNGFLDRQIEIDVAPYHIDADELLAMAREVADVDGSNPYRISNLAVHQQAGTQAKRLGVIYLITAEGSGAWWQEITGEAQAEAERIVGQIITAGMSDYEIVKALHDYLIRNCDYDQRYYTGIENIPDLSYTAAGALLEGTAVCAGYTMAYAALLDAAGIPNESITGQAGGYHAWNLVQVDGEWYHVDTTWDDPTNRGGDYIRYDYFLKSDLQMSRDHSRWDSVHDCTSTRYDDILPDTDEA